MPAITVDDTLVLPRLPQAAADAAPRPVSRLVDAHHAIEGAGFEVWRPFPGGIDPHLADPFFLLDQLGPVAYAPNEPVGAPWHPHRGFETVTYVLDGEIAHHDSNGGGGVIGEGDTQWMTAGAGILHDEVPTETFFRNGGVSHGVQLWVNLPAALKFTPPRYQAIGSGQLQLLTSSDGGALIRLIAGDLAGFQGPGSTHTPITYAHVTLSPGAEVDVPWDRRFSAMAYALTGRGHVGADRRPLDAHQLAVLGDGDTLRVGAAEQQPGDAQQLDVLLLGGLPIREPIAHYGPFLMNTREQVLEAIDDFNAGRMGTVPATTLGGSS
ncbi:pirin family protein [Dermatobacter hominis]|uniref:pirin family protein n=1 Tax=Dermatobacter hominis TaxID=2884263 RepID=UPI001D0F8C90|nr:pirin family protein [Dermatobacter hominis]UDY36778.1 pirin family protein [Dermatobacter hominis]